MHKMEELRKMLCSELDKISNKGELNTSSLDMVDKLTHSIKSIDTIMAMEDYEDDYSHGRGNGYSYENSYDNSYARGRGRYARRDSMGRYSNEDGYSQTYDGRGYSRDGGKDEAIKNLRELLNETSDSKVRMAIQKALDEMQRG